MTSLGLLRKGRICGRRLSPSSLRQNTARPPNEMRVFLHGKGRRFAIKTLNISNILYLVLFVPKPALAFTALLLLTGASIRATVDSSAHALWGKGRMERVEPRDDNDDRVVPEFKQDGGKGVIQEIQVPNMTLEELLMPSSKCNANQVGTTALAYIGDVVYELMVRARHVWPTRRTSDLQRQVVALVRGMLCFVVHDEFCDFASHNYFLAQLNTKQSYWRYSMNHLYSN